MMTNEPPRDAELEALLASLSRIETPSADFTDGVLHQLNERGLVGRSTSHGVLLLAATIVFAAGVMTGIAVRSASVKRAAMVATRPVNTTAPSARTASRMAGEVAASRDIPPIGHSEVWF